MGLFPCTRIQDGKGQRAKPEAGLARLDTPRLADQRMRSGVPTGERGRGWGRRPTSTTPTPTLVQSISWQQESDCPHPCPPKESERLEGGLGEKEGGRGAFWLLTRIRQEMQFSRDWLLGPPTVSCFPLADRGVSVSAAKRSLTMGTVRKIWTLSQRPQSL